MYSAYLETLELFENKLGKRGNYGMSSDDVIIKTT